MSERGVEDNRDKNHNRGPGLNHPIQGRASCNTTKANSSAETLLSLVNENAPGIPTESVYTHFGHDTSGP